MENFNYFLSQSAFAMCVCVKAWNLWGKKHRGNVEMEYKQQPIHVLGINVHFTFPLFRFAYIFFSLGAFAAFIIWT